jgi:hypothetical protein
MPIYCPHHLQLLLLNVSLLEIDTKIGANFMKGGVPTMATIEGTSLLLPGLIFTASMDFLAMTGGRTIGSEIEGILRPRCQLCQAFNHTAPHCPQLQNLGYGQQPSPNLALSNASSIGTTDWLPDTSANQHVTPNLANLTRSEPYLGNGKGLLISIIGHNKIHTPYYTFTLSNVHVPHITKPLLSVQKFYLDNNVYFEFHLFFYVKDLNTKVVPLSGQSRDGLYALTRSFVMSVPQAY